VLILLKFRKFVSFNNIVNSEGNRIIRGKLVQPANTLQSLFLTPDLKSVAI